jgi:hypothetical protein
MNLTIHDPRNRHPQKIPCDTDHYISLSHVDIRGTYPFGDVVRFRDLRSLEVWWTIHNRRH